ncbi:hypothetical protein F4820DRAFT_413952 [Hypoxylon rubiginosum]|uniref:Uncharacterized protein n=1 Tax=Hypoxylon rubiginosum TaxID=110542 RepID=A0ACB9Z742_9PEZI|nr:hypothetical protein F4820DRAFT_413952 [Hypoxylon rubiginosum]
MLGPHARRSCSLAIGAARRSCPVCICYAVLCLSTPRYQGHSGWGATVRHYRVGLHSRPVPLLSCAAAAFLCFTGMNNCHIFSSSALGPARELFALLTAHCLPLPCCFWATLQWPSCWVATNLWECLREIENVRLAIGRQRSDVRSWVARELRENRTGLPKLEPSPAALRPGVNVQPLQGGALIQLIQ